MSGSVRKALGAGLLLGYLLAYIVLVATLSGPVLQAPWWAQALFFMVAGIAWALPLRPLFVWMNRA